MSTVEYLKNLGAIVVQEDGNKLRLEITERGRDMFTLYNNLYFEGSFS